MENAQHSFIGTDAHKRAFGISHQDRRRQLHIIGQTGAGKSTLLRNLITQDLAHGRGVAVFDPHGDEAEALLSLVPPSRAHQLVYFNAADQEQPIGWNVLDGVRPHHRPLIADDTTTAFKRLSPDSWGPRLEHILLNSIRLLMDLPGASLLALPRLLIDERYRAHAIALASDPYLRAFWLNEFPVYTGGHMRSETLSPILNKIGRVLGSPAIRNIIAQPRSRIDLRRIMDEERILIVNLSKGSLGEGTAHLLGALLISGLTHTALSRRISGPERCDQR